MDIYVGITASPWSPDQEEAPGWAPCGQGLPEIDAEGQKGTLVRRPGAGAFSRTGRAPQDVWELEGTCQPELCPTYQQNLVQLQAWPPSPSQSAVTTEGSSQLFSGQKPSCCCPPRLGETPGDRFR